MTQPPDITPEEAQAEYKKHLAEVYGSAIRADFEERKNDERCSLSAH